MGGIAETIARLVTDLPLAVVRQHAAWALGRLGGARAVAVLAEAEAREVDPEVRAEIELALESGAAGSSG